MKEDIGKQNKHDKHNLSASGTTDADMQWFDQFDDQPGLQDVYSPSELNALKEKMLGMIKNKINELD